MKQTERTERTKQMKLMTESLTVVLITLLVLLLGYSTSYADLSENFPSSNANSSLYYQMGGGRSVPVPPVQNSVTVPIDAGGNIGLGFSCGLFSPVDTITNSLNNFEDSVENVPSTIVSNATSAIISFPMYKLAQADPKLYNILNNNVIGAHNQFSLNLKSCQSMQSEALKGQDPYNDWITVSRNNNMKSAMKYGDGDLNKAMSKVNQQQGDNGVAWATPGGQLGAHAGGVGQSPIMVVHDTAVAGFNVMLGRNVTDTSAPGKSANNQLLLNYWATPESAAKWIVSVVGDQKITTCTEASCVKDSTPGQGLLPYVQNATTDIQKKLIDLVSNPNNVNEKSLLAVSAPGQVISPALLNNIRMMNTNAQENTVGTLSQNIATTRIVNEALLAINVLQAGSQVPNIHSVAAAQKVLTQSIKRMQGDINQIMYSITIRRQLNSNVMSDIMHYNQAQNAQAASIPRLNEKPATMQNGGIVKQDQQS